MKNKTSISWQAAKEIILTNPEVKDAYEAELRAEKIRSQMEEWRAAAGLNRSQIASILGVSPAAVTRTENNAGRASLETLARYAKACGIEHPTIAL